MKSVDVKTATVRITATTPMLMHRDNIMYGEKVTAWRKNPENKDFSVNGDDRSPAWSWLGYVYYDQGLVILPRDYIMSAIRSAAAKITLKGKETYKKQSQSDIIIPSMGWPLTNSNNKTISWSQIKTLEGNKNFDDHENLVSNLGFTLDVRRAPVGRSKHVRVRPMFTDWSAEGEVMLTGELITKNILQQILDIAGRYCGFGDWRPSSSKSGPYGMFEAKVL